MIQISPYHPELDAIWHAVANAGARSLAVVAANPGEGTTLIATALARRAGLSASAETGPDGRRPPATTALLVDLDLTRPSVARSLGLRPAADEIVPLEAMGISVLGLTSATAAGEWRERSKLTRQLAAWRQEYNVVVLDTAPLLTGDADEITGATAASAADACVMVTLAGRTPSSRIREARDMLNAAGANLIGTILNDRDNPSLRAELDRQTYRLNRLLPQTMGKLRRKIARSPLLSARV